MANSNQDLHTARTNAADEFYTDYEDVKNEFIFNDVPVYYLKDKRVFCPCDDWKKSNFYAFLKNHFVEFGIKSLTALSYPSTNYVEYDGTHEEIRLNVLPNKSEIDNGDFSGTFSQYLMQCSDVIITNPPFSKFRQFFTQLIASGKEFLILGNINAVTYKEVFPHIVENQVWLGHSIHSGDRKFYVPDEYPLNGTACGTDDKGRYIRVKGVRWFTNMHQVSFENMFNYKTLEKSYKIEADYYKKFDTFDAINVNSYKEIPYDYDGYIGCPVTVIDYLNSHTNTVCFLNPNEEEIKFKVIGMLNSGGHPENFDFQKPIIENKCTFKRLIIEKVKN